MEKLCMKSFMANGHEFHLYLYEPVEGTPEGVVVKDANDILHHHTIKEFRWAAQFSDYFRYMLVYLKGGWWVDMDIVCLKPFVFDTPTVVSGSGGCIHNSPFKAEKGNKWLECALALIEDKEDDWGNMDWAAIGGPILNEAAKTFPVGVVNQFLFDPFQDSSGYQRFVDAESTSIPASAYSVHLHHAMWTLALGGAPRLDPDATYPASSIYEWLKERYL
jgi:hypothetical protein